MRRSDSSTPPISLFSAHQAMALMFPLESELPEGKVKIS